MSNVRTDVAVVGASLAGCSAARLFALRGLTVALVERQPRLDAFKQLCGHFIQPSAVPALRRLGLADLIEAAGGVRARAELWTPWGLIPQAAGGEDAPHGYAIRRSVLDPMLRQLAVSTPGVSYFPGHVVKALAEDGAVTANGPNGPLTIEARLVVGADGRNSTLAELARAPTATSPNHRFCYMAYFDDVGFGAGPEVSARLWALPDGDVAIASRNDGGVTLLALFLAKARLADFKRDREASFMETWRRVPDAPRIGDQVSRLVGYVDYPVQSRPAVPRPGVALVGDAAHSADPTWAIGCGWAFQTADWLVAATADALAGQGSLQRALKVYEATRRRRIGGHARFLAASARSIRPNPVQKLMFSAAAHDRPTARLLHAFAAREIPVRRFLSPRALARAALVNLRAA